MATIIQTTSLQKSLKLAVALSSPATSVVPTRPTYTAPPSAVPVDVDYEDIPHEDSHTVTPGEDKVKVFLRAASRRPDLGAKILASALAGDHAAANRIAQGVPELESAVGDLFSIDAE
jgi:hypothetical protein